MKLLDSTTLCPITTKLLVLLIIYTHITKNAHKHFNTFSNKKTTNRLPNISSYINTIGC